MQADEIQVHPAAAVFPMLSDDELSELAEDIRANGLHHPLVRDSEGRLVDGRNRNVACGMAGVEPSFITLPPETDVLAYILSENVRRRHMSKGQQAMAIAAMIETEEGKRDGKAKSLILDSNISQPHVAQAVTIRRHAAELSAGILAGTESFDAAYKTALARKQLRDEERDASQRRADEARIRLERLARAHPDIAALVPAELTLEAAEAAAMEITRRRAAEVESQSRLMETVLGALDPGLRAASSEKAAVILERLDASCLPIRPDFSPERIARARDTLTELVALLESQEVRNGRGAVPA